MIKKVKRICIWLYLVLTVYMLCFFTIYAYRYDVLDQLAIHDTQKLSLKEQKNVAIRLQAFTLENKNCETIKQVIKKELPDYSYHLYVKGYEDHVAGVSDGYAPDKHRAKYAQRITISFANTKASLTVVPRFTTYLKQYSMAAFLISSLCTLLLFGILHLCRKKIHGMAYLRTRFRHPRYKFLHSLSTKLILINVLAVMVTLGMFTIMYQNREVVFEFLAQWHPIHDDPTPYIKRVRAALKEEELNTNTYRNQDKLFIRLNEENYESYLYDEQGWYYMGSNYMTTPASHFIQGSVYDVDIVTTPYYYSYPIATHNQTLQLVIYEYPLIPYVKLYPVVCGILSIGYYFMILLLFARRKVHEIEYLQQDIQRLAAGEWDHVVNACGEDEIAMLATHLESFRISFQTARRKEEEARKANKGLISAISHDLRTPLTTLRSYIEIIQLHKGDSLQYEDYLKRCIGKIEEIKELSDKMFMYSFVYDCEEEAQMQPIQEAAFRQLIIESMEYLQLKGFMIKDEGQIGDITIYGNGYLMKRIFNNLISNMIKYADASEAIRWQECCDEEYLLITITNRMALSDEALESNKIGLKGVEKMMEAQGGSYHYQKEAFSFIQYLKLKRIKPEE